MNTSTSLGITHSYSGINTKGLPSFLKFASLVSGKHRVRSSGLHVRFSDQQQKPRGTLHFFPCSSSLDFRFWKLLFLVLCSLCFPPREEPVGWEGGWAGGQQGGDRPSGHAGLRSEPSIHVAELSGVTGRTWRWKEARALLLCAGINYLLAFSSSSAWHTCCPLAPMKNPNEDAHVRLRAVLQETWEMPRRSPTLLSQIIMEINKKQF